MNFSRSFGRIRIWLMLVLGTTIFGPAQAHAADGMMTLNGLHYFVRDSGGSGTPVLFIHGMPDDGTVWDNQARVLANAGYRVIRPDLVGFGKSDKPTDLARYKTGSVAADLVSLLDQLKISGPVDVVGHDWGSSVAWDFYYSAPGRTRAIATLTVGHIATFAAQSLNFEHGRWQWYMLLNSQPRAAEIYRAKGGQMLREVMIATHPRRDAVVDDLLKPGGVEAMLRWDQANPVADFFLAAIDGTLDAIPPVDVPVLGIAGTADPYLWTSQMRDSGAHVTGSWRYAEIQGAGHWLMLDHADEVSKLLLDWLNQNRSSKTK